MHFFLAKLAPQADHELVWEALSEYGGQHLMIIEGAEGAQVLAAFPDPSPPSLNGVEDWSPYSMGEVDWEQQWKDHLPEYKKGVISFSCASKDICLGAGPGFGDSSHPTTALILELMEKKKEELSNSHVVDIGCGSGILSFAAAAYGSPLVTGVDIDPAALAHAKKNLELNSWAQACTHFCSTENFSNQSPVVILLNMISSEQEQVWASHPSLHEQNTLLITSGVRAEELEEYTQRWEKRSWVIEHMIEKEGWLGFIFITNIPNATQKLGVVQKIE